MTKNCNKCKQTKKLTEFCKNSLSYLGLSNKCKDCAKLYNKEYREKNREKLLKKDNERYKNNREVLKKKAREYKLKNKDYYNKHNKNYYKLNKHIFLAANSKRRKVILRATPQWLSEPDKGRIEDFYWFAQDLYKVTGEVYHVDHIVPLQGKTVCGLHVPWNLQILPADLNLSKGNNMT